MDNAREPYINILSLTLKTFAYTVIAAFFLIALFTLVFPYRSMLFYSDLNLKKRAAECAESFVERKTADFDENNLPAHDSKYADALLFSLKNNISFMQNSEKEKGAGHKRTYNYAVKVADNADLYLSFNSLRERSLLEDAYNTSASVNPDLFSHPLFYSFENRIETARAEALLITGDIKTEYDSLNLRLNAVFAQGNKIDGDNIGAAARVLNRAVAVINKAAAQKDNSPLFAEGLSIIYNKTSENKVGQAAGFTSLYTDAEKFFPLITGYLFSYSADVQDPYVKVKTLKALFEVKAAIDFLLALDNAAAKGAAAFMPEDILKLKGFSEAQLSREVNGQTLSGFYSELLAVYANLFKP